MKIKSVLIISFLVFIFSSCKEDQKTMASVSDTAEQVVEVPVDIDVPTANDIATRLPDVVWLDVRTPEEIALGKIDDALELDFTDPGFKEKVGTLDKNKTYIVYCAAGGRSAKASTLMKEMGFTKAHNLKGGYTAWSKQ